MGFEQGYFGPWGLSQISLKGVITKGDLVYRQYCLLPAPKQLLKILISYFTVDLPQVDLFFILHYLSPSSEARRQFRATNYEVARSSRSRRSSLFSNDETNRPGKNYWKGIWKGLSESLDFNEPARTPKSNEPAIYRRQRYTPTNVTLKKRQKPSAFYDRCQPSAGPR